MWLLSSTHSYAGAHREKWFLYERDRCLCKVTTCRKRAFGTCPLCMHFCGLNFSFSPVFVWTTERNRSTENHRLSHKGEAQRIWTLCCCSGNIIWKQCLHRALQPKFSTKGLLPNHEQGSGVIHDDSPFLWNQINHKAKLFIKNDNTSAG